MQSPLPVFMLIVVFRLQANYNVVVLNRRDDPSCWGMIQIIMRPNLDRVVHWFVKVVDVRSKVAVVVAGGLSKAAFVVPSS